MTSKRFGLSLQIAVAVVAALIVGPLLGQSAVPLGELGRLLIQLIKAVATPLLFLAIISAIVTTELERRAGARMLVLALINGCLALGMGLLLSNAFQPGRWFSVEGLTKGGDLTAYQGKKIDLLQTLASYVPSNTVQPFIDNAVISVVLLAVLFGFGLRRLKDQEGFKYVTEAVATLLKLMEVVLGWVIKLIPFAVFGVLARTVGQYGYEPLKGLAGYVGVALLGLLLHVLIVYSAWIRGFARMPLRVFWKEAKEPVTYAVGANSSLATLPVTLRALDRLGVSRASSALGACVGTNFNNDGILLYEGMAVLFVAQASGLHLSLGQQIVAAATAMIAAMGVAGVPEAGFISLALVLNTLDLPVTLLPLLLTVDWIVSRGRSVTNVLSDMVLSLSLDRWSALSDKQRSPALEPPPQA